MSNPTRPLEITCEDGYVLSGNLYVPDAQPEVVVLLHPATGVPQHLYASFAEALRGRGWASVTYDYRGIGASRVAGERVQAGFTTWADLDVEAVTAWARGAFPDASLLAVGHSFGGHAIGLCQSSEELRGAVLIASHAGCLRFVHATLERWRVGLMLKVLGPVSARTLGYFPASRLGMGEDLPGQVSLEWSRWTSLPRYFFDDPTVNAAERFSRTTCPVLSIGLDDDPWAPPEAIDLVAEHFTSSDVERRQLGPKDANGVEVGHLGFFRSRHAETLWPGVIDWMSDVLEA